MKKTITFLSRRAAVMLLAMMLTTATAWAQTTITPTTPSQDGDGYYLIGSAAELYGFAQLVNNGNATANAKLTADIVVNENVLDANGEANTGDFVQWTPIGNDYFEDKVYSGTFDGQGHTISGLYVSGSGWGVGLIGTASGSAVVKNLGIVDSYFSSSNNFLGSIVGRVSYNTSVTLANVYSTSTVKGDNWIGGLAGGGDGSFSFINSYFAGKTSAGWSYGSHHDDLVAGDFDRSTLTVCNAFVLGTSQYGTSVTAEQLSDGTVAAALHYYQDALADGSMFGLSGGKTNFSGTIDGVSVTTANITLHTFDGDATAYSSKYIVGNTTPLPVNVEREGYTFFGWYDNADLEGDAVTSISSSETDDKEYWAKFERSHAVSFVLGGGTIRSGEIDHYIEGEVTPLPTFVLKDGASFEGWYTTEDFTGDRYYFIPATATEDMTFYAKWGAAKTTFYLRQGDSPEPVSILYEGENMVWLDETTMEGYVISDNSGNLWGSNSGINVPYTGGESTFGFDASELSVAQSGFYVFTLTDKGDENWFVSVLKSMLNCDVASIPTQVYTGSEIEPVVTVKDGQATLTPGEDYEVTYSNNVNAGTATVTITGKGDYSGETAATFTIVNPVTTSYVDATGTLHENVEAVPLDNTMTTLPAGWYVVKNNVTFSDDLSTDADGEVNIILCDGATLTANNITPIGNSDYLRIYGQSQSTGTANISGRIEASSSLQIYGGTINVTGNIMCRQSGVGIYGGNVTAADINGHEGSLSLKGGTITASSLTVDQGSIKLGGATVKANSYNVTQGNVTILTGITYYDGTGASYTEGDLTSGQVSAIAGKILRTYDYRGGTCGKDDLNVTWALAGTSPNYTLTISGTGAMKDYDAPDDLPWKDYRSLIASVIIEDGVTSIGNFAFEGCNNANLTSVTIPASVTRIGNFAFGYCTYLASVTIPVASLTYYGVNAFDNTAAGLKIYVPGSALSTYEAATNWSAYKDNFVGVYTLTYNLAGGTLPAGKSNPESYTAEDKNFLLNNPTKEGYAFAGWKYDYTEGNNTSNHTEVFVEVVPFWEQDLSFTATWVAEDATHKDLAKCRIEVDNPLYIGKGNYVGYYYDGGNGIKVYDGDKLLTYYHYDSEKGEMVGDYSYSMLVSLDGGDCEDMGEHCRVLLTGEGNYVSGLSADVVIVANSVNGKWGDLKWAYDNGTLTISRKDGVTEDVVMDPMSSTGEGYDSWLGIGSGIFSIVFEEGVKTIAETAFGYVGDGLHHYSNLATISLPSSLTEIGANAFAHCDGLTVDLDDILAKNITLGNNAFYQIGCLAGSLANMANNATKIALLDQAISNNITLKDRTLYKDGDWNTLCLPFALGNAMADEGHHFDGTLLEGATVMELSVLSSGLSSGGELTLTFINALSIEAGKPYIVKWASADNLVNPVFNGVNIINTEPTPVEFEFEGNSAKCQFVGNYNPKEITEATNRNNIVVLAGGNKLGYTTSDRTIENGKALGAFRAYFYIPEKDGTTGASSFVLNFGDEETTTGIVDNKRETITNNHWYSLDGRKLDGKPTQKGLYIVNGRKVVIK